MNSPDPQARRQAAADDVALVARIARRDSDALGDLYERFAGLLLALSRRIVGSHEEAEDVLQEVFVQVWNQAGRYESKRSSVSTWLTLITRSRSIDRLRSRQVQRRTAASAHEENPPEDTSPEGMGNVLDQERRRRLLTALSELPDEQRKVLELAFFGGLTQSEISDSTGTPLGTVKTRTLLAMRKLRRALDQEVRDLI
jgi:RNA polymerase sigma-70 factor (ECF subfamily)